MMKHFSVICFLILMTLSACRKDSDIIKTTIDAPDPDVFVEASFKGQVLDQTLEPLADAMVRIANTVVTTDETGRFEVQNITVAQNATIAAFKTGFFYGASVAFANAGDLSYTEIVLYEKGTPETFMSSDGKVLSLPDGSTLTIFPGSVRSAGGGNYEGEVNLYFKQTDPLSPDYLMETPGDLTGTAEGGGTIGLKPFGQLTFEIEDSSGEELEIEAGMEAEVMFEVPDGLLSEAPADLPIWTYDSSENAWLKKGNCTLEQNGFYKGKCMPGFSACAKTLSVVYISGKVFYGSLNQMRPAKFHELTIEAVDGEHIFTGFTSSAGVYGGFVASNSTLQVAIIDHCTVEMYNDNIGPFSMPEIVPDLFITESSDPINFRMTGYLQDCDETPLNQNTGFLMLKLQNGAHVKVPFDGSGGYFNRETFSDCSFLPGMSLMGIDSVNKTRTIAYPVGHTDEIDLGTMKTCMPSQDSANFTVDGIDYFLSPSYYYLTGDMSNQHLLTAYTMSGYVSLLFETPVTALGEYTALFDSGGIAGSLVAFGTKVYITEDDGEYLRGYTSGTVNNGASYTFDFVAKKE